MSNVVYVIRNQHGLYLNKQQEWVDGRDAQSLFRCVHHDEAINTVFEVSAREITLRAEALACPLDARKNPQVEAAGELDFGRGYAPADEPPTGDAEPSGPDGSPPDAATTAEEESAAPDQQAAADQHPQPDPAG
jgi:hypothetical protein